MVKVSNIKNSASQNENLNDKNAEFSVTDSLGRTYILKRPSYLKGLQLAKTLGDLADNNAYYNGVYYFTWIKSINGFEPPMGTVAEIEALAQKIDHEGIIAIREKVLEVANAAGKTQEELEEQQEQENKTVQKHAKK
jgi:hypothetical protein